MWSCFYEVTGGRITLDGADITELPRDELRSAIGMVLQDTWLLGASSPRTSPTSHPGITRADVERAARVTQADRLIRTLPLGYDTAIDDEGVG